MELQGPTAIQPHLTDELLGKYDAGSKRVDNIPQVTLRLCKDFCNHTNSCAQHAQMHLYTYFYTYVFSKGKSKI